MLEWPIFAWFFPESFSSSLIDTWGSYNRERGVDCFRVAFYLTKPWNSHSPRIQVTICFYLWQSLRYTGFTMQFAICLFFWNSISYFIKKYQLQIISLLLHIKTVSYNFLWSNRFFLLGLTYTPTSTLFLHVPSVCRLQWHPFTVISSSNLEMDKLSVAIKCQGSWTQKLYKQLSLSLDHVEASTEGPYGSASSHFLR